MLIFVWLYAIRLLVYFKYILSIIQPIELKKNKYKRQQWNSNPEPLSS